MRLAVIRGLCALACALAFHALLVIGAVRFGWLAPDDATLPELDLTSVDLSFSDTPDDTAAPVAQPPAPAVDAPPPPPPPETHASEPPPIELPPDPQATVIPRPAEPRPTDLRPPLSTPPEPEPQPRPQPQPSPESDPPKEAPPPEPQQPSAAAPAAPAPTQARVKVDKQPKLKSKIDTRKIYPEGARERGEEGSVAIIFEVTPEGRSSNMRIVASCGFAELEQAAIQAVKRARFTPARRGSAAVPATARLTLTFRLKD